MQIKKMIAPNRTLNLNDLKDEYYKQLNSSMQVLIRQFPEFYLHPSKQWEYGWALERANLKKSDRILDIGCGNSIFPVYLADQGYDITACDFELPETDHGKGVNYLQSDIRNLPFENDSFDKIFCISVIEHLPVQDIYRAIENMARVLKPEGAILLTTDYFEDADTEIWHISPDNEFRVDWNVFDEKTFKKYIIENGKLRLEGAIDMSVDWDETKPQMRDFHGYPYTSIAVKLIKNKT